MRRPFVILKESAFEDVEIAKQNSKFIFEQTDKIVTWLVGFSFAAISLIIVNYIDIIELFGKYIFKWSILLFSLTIIFGLIYRISGFYLQIAMSKINTMLKVIFSEIDMMNFQRELGDEQDIHVVIQRIKEDFGADTDDSVSIYEKLPENAKAIFLKSKIDYYYSLKNWAEKDYEAGIEFIKKMYKKFNGYSDKKLDKIFDYETNHHFWRKILQGIWQFCFTASSITFMISLILIIISMLLN